MSKEAISDVQKALNTIRSAIAEEDRDTQLATLALLVATSADVVATARKIEGDQTKVRTQKVAIPKTKVIKQQSPQPQTADDGEREKRDTKPQTPQPPLTPHSAAQGIRKGMRTAWLHSEGDGGYASLR